MVCHTANVPSVLTMMDELVAPVLHNKLPGAVVDNVDVPLQLFTTFTTGVAGTDVGVLITASVCEDGHPAAFLAVTL